MLANAASITRRPWLFFSLEMGREQLVQRILCRQAQSICICSAPGVCAKDFQAVDSRGPSARPRFTSMIHPSLNILELRAKCRRLKAQQGLDMVHGGLPPAYAGRGTPGKPPAGNLQISRGLKGLAKELEIPGRRPVQLSRAGDLEISCWRFSWRPTPCISWR